MNRSDRLYSIALGVANRDWTKEEFELLIQTPGTLAHELFASRAEDPGPEQTLEWAMKHIWEKAVAHVEANPPVGAHAVAPMLPHLLAYEAGTTRSGRSGPARRAVFLALVRCYANYGTEPFRASRRQLLELSGLGSTNTVAAALDALEADQVIVKRSRVANAATDEHGATDAWRFGSAVTRLAVGDPVARTLPLDLVGHDLFHYRQLGKTAELVYHRIVQGVDDEDSLRSRTGLTARTLHRHLQELGEAGLICRDGAGSWVSTGVMLDEVAQQLEIPSYSEALKVRHHHQRLAYQEWRSKREHQT